jgi:hypothetical protein
LENPAVGANTGDGLKRSDGVSASERFAAEDAAKVGETGNAALPSRNAVAENESLEENCTLAAKRALSVNSSDGASTDDRPEPNETWSGAEGKKTGDGETCGVPAVSADGVNSGVSEKALVGGRSPDSANIEGPG